MGIGIDPTEVTYDTWILGFNDDQNITDYEVFLDSAKTKEDSLKFVENLDREKLKLRKDLPEDVVTLALVVETVGTDKFDCVSFNIRNLYEEFIQIR